MTPPRFQVSLQRMLVAVALFAVLFGASVPFFDSRPNDAALYLGVWSFVASFCVPPGVAIAGWRGLAFCLIVVTLPIFFAFVFDLFFSPSAG